MNITSFLQNKKTSFTIGLLTTLFVIIIGGTIYAQSKKSNQSIPLPQTDLVSQNGGDRTIPTPPPDLELPDPTEGSKKIGSAKHIGVLLLGYGGAGHQGGFLSDVIILIYFDLQSKKIAFIHIPRDTWISIPTNTTPIDTKINGALALGTKSGNYPIKDLPSDAVLRGSYLTKNAVKQITGLDIDFVVGIDFSSFNRAIDAIGGVDVQVSPAFDDQWYPIKGRELELCGHSPESVTAMSATMSGFNLEKQFPCRYEHLQFQSGINHMNGETALKFVRSRHSSSDFARGLRQIALLQAVQNKLFSLKVLDKIPEFYKATLAMLKTDIAMENVTELVTVLKDLPSYTPVVIGLSTENFLQGGTSKSGGSILIPKSGEGNWQDINNAIKGKLSP